MNRAYYYPDDKMISDKSYYSLQHTEEIFRAFVDAIIPRTPRLAEEYGKVQYFGALDLYTDEYIIMTLNNYYIPLAEPVAAMLEAAEEQLPIPFKDNPGYILNITSALNRFTMMGYYSEWFGYGSTRLESPNQRKLEYYPLSWKQVGYPGPSLGYRALRVNNSK